MDRWQHISALFHDVLAQSPATRDEYLRHACGDDDDLRRQVETLLAATEQTRTVAGAAPDDRRREPLAPGQRLARYEIVGQLGAGGMGEVYRARDFQLQRDIALKVLPPSDLHDQTARARLVREARAAAALNHPNICTVHEVGEETGQAYIAMELVEGRTLSAIVAAGALPPEDVVRIGAQLADALSHAHDRGVVHRDLKSNNIIVTPDGRAKVLDFGLAKRSTSADLAVTYMQVSLTQSGVAAGTLPYMSPEQLRGEPATPASDIWALGVVLYEMIAGTRPFAGQTPFEVSAGILNASPRTLAATVPPRLGAIVHRCLAKDAADRFATAAAVREALEAIGSLAPAVVAPLAPARARSGARVRRPFPLRRAIVVSALAFVAAAGVAGWRVWQTAAPARTLAVLPFANPANDPDLEYLCEGVAEILIRRLSPLPAIRLSHLATVLSLKRLANDPVAAGRDLGVQTVLAGSLTRDGARLRITARLVEVASGRELWTNSYDRPAAELLNVQDDIATSIMDEGLRVRLDPDERRRMIQHPTTNGDAYDLFLQASYIQRGSTEEDYLYSRELLERAVNHDNTFALAYIALAGNYAMMATDGLSRPNDAWAQVSRYVRLARQADPELSLDDPIEHALAFLFNWDWEGAARARERVLQAPMATIVPDGLRALAIELWAIGKPDEALALSRRMRELDPRASYLVIGEADLLLRMGRLDEAITLYQRTEKFESNNPNLYFGLAEALFRRGRFDEALAMRRRAHMLAGDDRLESLFATARGQRGYQDIDRAWARIQLEMLKERQVNRYVSPLDFARTHAHLGDTEQAFKYLEASFDDRSPGLVFLKVDPAWDKLRGDPRFAEAVKRVGIP
jgi:serine/threonine-protein kinase